MNERARLNLNYLDSYPAMSPGIYHQLLPWQTRIIRLYGDRGDPRSPVACDLISTDLLHLKFGGVALGSSAGTVAHVVTYDAISYTWEGQKNSQSVLCNESTLPVTKNVYEPLAALRYSSQQHRYLWIDAICINQNDDNEKAIQVQNMLVVYQTAQNVIA